MIRYLVDTNILSEPLRPRPDSQVLNKLRELDGQYATAAPVIEELTFGACRLPVSRRRTRIESYVADLLNSGLQVLPFDLPAARWQGKERARLVSLGTPVPLFDLQIAAIAQVNGLVLVTRNVKDVARLEGVEIENWFA